MTTKDNLLDCIDFISECIALDGIGKIDALER